MITDEQAAELQEMIKAIAEELTRQSVGSGQQKNYYASLFGELHRRFRVSTYKNLTIEKYERAMAWLRDYDEAIKLIEWWGRTCVRWLPGTNCMQPFSNVASCNGMTSARRAFRARTMNGSTL